MSNTTECPRSLHTIAREICSTWVDKKGHGKIWFGAVPYVEAMLQLQTMQDKYLYDSAESIVLYFLSNAQTWRGPDARRIKAELKGMLK